MLIIVIVVMCNTPVGVSAVFETGSDFVITTLSLVARSMGGGGTQCIARIPYLRQIPCFMGTFTVPNARLRTQHI